MFVTNNRRLKALSSEVSSNPKNNTQYALLQEMATYNVAKEVYNYAPDARLVSINDDPEAIMIEWIDNFENYFTLFYKTINYNLN